MEQTNQKPITLPNKKMVLMPVPRAGGLITDPNHKAFFMFPDTMVRFCLPYDMETMSLAKILTDEERQFFEGITGKDMNFYKMHKDNFWRTFEVKIKKDDDFMKNGITYDLSDPMDNLAYRVLNVQPTVAPTWEQRFDRGEYRFALRDLGYVEEQRIARSELNLKAYGLFGKMENSAQKLYDFLSVYFMQTGKGKRPPDNANKETYKGLIQDIIDNNVKEFISIAEDANFATKLMAVRGLSQGHITRDSFTKNFTIADTKRHLGASLDEVVANLLSPEFQEDKLRLEALIKSTKS